MTEDQWQAEADAHTLTCKECTPNHMCPVLTHIVISWKEKKEVNQLEENVVKGPYEAGYEKGVKDERNQLHALEVRIRLLNAAASLQEEITKLVMTINVL